MAPSSTGSPTFLNRAGRDPNLGCQQILSGSARVSNTYVRTLLSVLSVLGASNIQIIYARCSCSACWQQCGKIIPCTRYIYLSITRVRVIVSIERILKYVKCFNLAF